MSELFRDELDSLARQGLMRTLQHRSDPQGRVITVDGRELINFASNDYLGLAAHPALIKAATAAMARYGLGSGGSRLLGGGTEAHRALEETLAKFKGTEAALTFSSGYAANLSTIPALAGEADEIFSDSLNHASLIDGARLSKAQVRIYRHCDAGDLDELLKTSRARRKLVITDTVFSMDGDIAPLADIHALCERHGSMLYTDDAHGTGVLGSGHGAIAHAGLPTNTPWLIQMGTLSKALGLQGGFIAGTGTLCQWLVNRARGFVYSTAQPAALAAAALQALELATDRALLEKLWLNRNHLAASLQSIGIDTKPSQSPIMPIHFPDTESALRASAVLLEAGLYAPAIRPPTVPTARLRITVSVSHTHDDMLILADTLKALR